MWKHQPHRILRDENIFSFFERSIGKFCPDPPFHLHYLHCLPIFIINLSSFTISISKKIKIKTKTGKNAVQAPALYLHCLGMWWFWAFIREQRTSPHNGEIKSSIHTSATRMRFKASFCEVRCICTADVRYSAGACTAFFSKKCIGWYFALVKDVDISVFRKTVQTEQVKTPTP